MIKLSPPDNIIATKAMKFTVKQGQLKYYAHFSNYLKKFFDISRYLPTVMSTISGSSGTWFQLI